MGQNVFALVVGVPMNESFMEAIRDLEELDDMPQLPEELAVSRWYRQPHEDIGLTATGFPYAVQRGHLDGCAEMEFAYPLDGIARFHAREQERARGRWTAYAKLLEAKGIEVPPPQVLLVQIEVS
jgi:hypothetical protein